MFVAYRQLLDRFSQTLYKLFLNVSWKYKEYLILKYIKCNVRSTTGRLLIVGWKTNAHRLGKFYCKNHSSVMSLDSLSSDEKIELILFRWCKSKHCLVRSKSSCVQVTLPRVRELNVLIIRRTQIKTNQIFNMTDANGEPLEKLRRSVYT
jgi:hypothetical protein